MSFGVGRLDWFVADEMVDRLCDVISMMCCAESRCLFKTGGIVVMAGVSWVCGYRNSSLTVQRNNWLTATPLEGYATWTELGPFKILCHGLGSKFQNTPCVLHL